MFKFRKSWKQKYTEVMAYMEGSRDFWNMKMNENIACGQKVEAQYCKDQLTTCELYLEKIKRVAKT